MIWIDKKYIHICSGHLRNFKQKSHSLYNFSCPICGDSETNTRKARGYLIEKDNRFVFYCHNCFRSLPFGKFLKEISPAIYKDYVMEKFRERGEGNKKRKEAKKVEGGSNMKLFKMFSSGPQFRKFCIRATDLPESHPALEYLVNRQIPLDKIGNFYYCEDFKRFEDILPDYEGRLRSEPRIVLPVRDRKDEIVAFVCRALDQKSSLRYVNLLVDKNGDKFLYNINNIDFNRRVYVVEGPIDSLFLNNCVAVGTADFSCVQSVLVKDQTTLVFDNQPLNRSLLNNIYKMANRGWSIVVWPSFVKGKDINDMIRSGVTADEVKKIIDEHTYSGLKLKLKLAEWTKR